MCRTPFTADGGNALADQDVIKTDVRHGWITGPSSPFSKKMNSLLLAIKANDISEIQRLLTYSPICRKLVTYQAPENNETPLFVASVRGYTGVARWLLTRGARVEVTTSWGATALHAAAERGHEAIVKLLIENEAPLHLQTQYGDTALHLAAFRGHHRVVLVLLAAGIDESITNSKGRTARDEAKLAGHPIIYKYLGYERLARMNNKTEQYKRSSSGLMQTELIRDAKGNGNSRDDTKTNKLDCDSNLDVENSSPSQLSSVPFDDDNSRSSFIRPVQEWVRSCQVSTLPPPTTVTSQRACKARLDTSGIEMLAAESHTNIASSSRRKAARLRDCGKSQSCERLDTDTISPYGKPGVSATASSSGAVGRTYPRCRRVNSLERAIEELQAELRAAREEVEQAKADISNMQDIMRVCWLQNGAFLSNRKGVEGQRYIVSPCSSDVDPFEVQGPPDSVPFNREGNQLNCEYLSE